MTMERMNAVADKEAPVKGIVAQVVTMLNGQAQRYCNYCISSRTVQIHVGIYEFVYNYVRSISDLESSYIISICIHIFPSVVIVVMKLNIDNLLVGTFCTVLVYIADFKINNYSS